MKPTGNLVADTICRTTENGLAITCAADAGALTIIEATPVAVIDVCPDCGPVWQATRPHHPSTR
ncbi:hypothetical protein ACDL65_10100 [Corynebacterium belfantii]